MMFFSSLHVLLLVDPGTLSVPLSYFSNRSGVLRRGAVRDFTVAARVRNFAEAFFRSKFCKNAKCTKKIRLHKVNLHSN